MKISGFDLLQKLYDYVDISKKQLESLGYKMNHKKYTVELSGRMKSVLGTCSHKRGDNIHYILKFNEEYIRKTNDESIRNTVMHEMCHSIDNAINHGYVWQLAASRVNKSYGYNIKRTADEIVGYDYEPNYKYSLICKECQKEYKYCKLTKVVKYAIEDKGNVKCPKCGCVHFYLNMI